MHLIRKRRLIRLSLVLSGLAIATAFILYSLKQNINLYFTPSEIGAQQQSLTQFRIGGMVKKGSVTRSSISLDIDFLVTDYTKDLKVHYTGVLPALFREGQGVVAQGYLEKNGVFRATQVLAKHDEKYMPPKIKAKRMNV